MTLMFEGDDSSCFCLVASLCTAVFSCVFFNTGTWYMTLIFEGDYTSCVCCVASVRTVRPCVFLSFLLFRFPVSSSTIKIRKGSEQVKE